MRILVCGSRNWTDREAIKKAFDTVLAEIGGEFEPTPVVIDGCARGADTLAHEVAEEYGCETERYPADWGRHGRAAGLIRNRQMLDVGKPDLVLAFWDGQSRGTQHMINIAKGAGVKVCIIKG